jgi:hypothetical protein
MYLSSKLKIESRPTERLKVNTERQAQGADVAREGREAMRRTELKRRVNSSCGVGAAVRNPHRKTLKTQEPHAAVF